MNSPIVNRTYCFVKKLYSDFLPPGYCDFQLDLSMDLKNRAVSTGLQHDLSDEQIELLCLAALLHNTGCVESQLSDRTVSKAIASKFLAEQRVSQDIQRSVLQLIDATLIENVPQTRLAKIFQATKFKPINPWLILNGHQEIGDVWP